VRRVLFTWRGYEIRSYPALLYVGVVAGLVAGDLAAHAVGLDAARVYVALLLLLIPALLGARLASVAGNWPAYRANPRAIWRRSEGGQAMYGGLVAVPLSVPLLAALHLSFAAFWDVAAFSMLTGMAFTRVGCLLNGCCAGRPTNSRFGLVLTDARGVRVRRVPTQLLEAGLAVVLLAGSAALAAARPAPGTVFAAALGGYAAGRLLLQPLRERQSRLAGVPALGTASVGLLAVALVWIVVRVA
jgi:phosphatidylglycerol:prolipoprotein diacylglycerol transferase